MSAFNRVHWLGNIPDWRNERQSDFDPDDEEMDETPPGVVKILGFDPKEIANDDGK